MKKLLFFLFSLASLMASGQQNIVMLAPGSQPGFQLKSNTRYVVPAGALVTFTSSLGYGNVINCTLDGSKGLYSYGFATTVTGTVFNHNGGGNINDSVIGFDFGNIPDLIAEGGGTNITYKGTPQTCLYYKLIFKHIKFAGRTRLFYGTWAVASTYANVIAGFEAYDVIYTGDGTGDPVKFFGTGVYGALFQDWVFKGPAGGNVDCGKIWIQDGNCRIVNFRQDNTWGYVLRQWTTTLSGLPGINQTTGASNVLDVNGTYYGTFDIRLGTVDTTLLYKLIGTDFTIANVTTGDKTGPNYVTPLLVGGVQSDKYGRHYKIYVNNSFAFNARKDSAGQDNGSSLYKDNGSGKDVVITNCIDLPPGVPLPAGYLIDKVNYQPVSGSVLDKKGIGYRTAGAVVKPPPVDTVVNTCPPPVVCKVCPIVDTAAILKLHPCPVCPAPVVCPVCPTCPAIPAERVVTGIQFLPGGKIQFTYNRGAASTL